MRGVGLLLVGLGVLRLSGTLLNPSLKQLLLSAILVGVGVLFLRAHKRALRLHRSSVLPANNRETFEARE